MSERTTNINIGGGNIGGLQIGDNNQQTITQNNGEQLPTIPEVFGSIRKALPPIQSTIDEEVADDFEEEVMRPLQTFAELPAEEQKQPSNWEQCQTLISKLVPYAPQIGKGLAVFGATALSTLANRNPVISGIMAVCKMASAENQTS